MPTTAEGLAVLAGAGSLGAGPQPAYAVTETLVAWWTDGAGARPDDEELEYAATLQAAAASLALLEPRAVTTGTAPACRVVLAADADAVGTSAADDDAPGAVSLPASPPRRDVVALLVDTVESREAVVAAVAALADDEAPTSAVEQALAAIVERDLAWYSPHELAGLVTRLLG